MLKSHSWHAATLIATCLGLCALADAQEQYATINSECAVTLVGDFHRIQGITATSSEAGRLIQDSREINGIGTVGLSLPYLIGGSAGTGTHHAVVGGPVIDASGETKTSILYTGTYEDAQSGDLQVEVNVRGDQTIPFVAGDPANYAGCSELEPAIVNGTGNFSGILGGVASDERYASVVDGAVTLNGTFEELSGLEVKAISEGLISQATYTLEGVGEVSLTTPFHTGHVISRSKSILLGIFGRANRINVVQSSVKPQSYTRATIPLVI